MPRCLSIGITEEEFWGMTLRRLRIREKAYELSQQTIDTYMWMMGQYVACAINCTIGNLGRTKPAEYPDEPFSQHKEPTDEELLQQMLFNEELWIANSKMKNLEETII